MARFDKRLTGRLPGTRDVLRILLKEGGFRGRGHPERAAAQVPRAAKPLPLPAVAPGGFSLTWIGHATFLVRLGGRTILTDPIFSRRLPNLWPRVVPPGIAFDELPPIDALVVSHDHYDHLDAATVRRLPRDIAVFVPLGLGGFFRRRGFRRVRELDWWEAARDGGVSFTCTPVHHWSGRLPWDNLRSLWGGWSLEAGDRRLLFAGDSGYGGHFADIGRRLGPFDAAMMPIGAYAPRWFMRPVHMDPDEAVQACRDLGARRLASMHWGTFVLTQEPLLEPLERVRAAWAAAGLARPDLWDLAVGETRVA